jgi:uridine kinase
MAPRKALVVGISGASSSGKTTLSRLIRDIFPNTLVLHEDDFYKEEKRYVDDAFPILSFPPGTGRPCSLDYVAMSTELIPRIF